MNDKLKNGIKVPAMILSITFSIAVIAGTGLFGYGILNADVREIKVKASVNCDKIDGNKDLIHSNELAIKEMASDIEYIKKNIETVSGWQIILMGKVDRILEKISR